MVGDDQEWIAEASKVAEARFGCKPFPKTMFHIPTGGSHDQETFNHESFEVKCLGLFLATRDEQKRALVLWLLDSVPRDCVPSTGLPPGSYFPYTFNGLLGDRHTAASPGHRADGPCRLLCGDHKLRPAPHSGCAALRCLR